MGAPEGWKAGAGEGVEVGVEVGVGCVSPPSPLQSLSAGSEALWMENVSGEGKG